MQKVDGLVVDLGRELRELVQLGLVLAPVVATPPILGQLLQVIEWHPPTPADAGYLVGPAGAGQPLAQVVQVSLGDGNGEWLDSHGNAPSSMNRNFSATYTL